MGKEETIGLIRPGHTSPAEIKQKSLHYRAPAPLTLVLPTRLREPGAAHAFSPSLVFSQGETAMPEESQHSAAALWERAVGNLLGNEISLFFFFSPVVYEPSYRI